MSPLAAPAPPLVPEARKQCKQYRLPSVLMRSGTSRGLFLHRHDLSLRESEWGPILTSAMGSRNGDQRQLEGVGGATSTTSKVVVVSKSHRPGIDVEYTFVQAAVGQEIVDMTGNCGNMASGIGAFALDEGLVEAAPGQTELVVRIFNTNTQSTLVQTIQVDSDGKFLPDGDYRISGVAGSGSCVKVAFRNPGGSVTGKVFPTGNRQDEILVTGSGDVAPFTVRASLIDLSNPFIFVDAATLPATYHAAGAEAETSLEIIEAIRRHGAVHFGIAPDPETACLRRGTPKIALLSPSQSSSADYPLSVVSKHRIPDINVLAYSMGKVHPSFQLTGAVCLGAAICLRGTVAADLCKQRQFLRTPLVDSPASSSGPWEPDQVLGRVSDGGGGMGKKKVVIAHRSGEMDVEVDIDRDEQVRSVVVGRTARRLFEGSIIVSL